MLTLRVELKEPSDLGEFGAAPSAMPWRPGHRAAPLGADHRPHPRTARGPGRPPAAPRPAPPPGWYLPDLAARRAELDSFDIVEGLVIKGGPHVEVLNAVSLHGGLVGLLADGAW